MANETIGLGDTVRIGSGGTGNDICTVSQVHKDGTVDLFRVYTTTADFSYAGRGEGSSAVICYIGTEEVRGIDPKNLTLLNKGKALR